MGDGGTDETVLGEQVALGAVGDESRSQPVVVRLADGPVDRSPPDLAVAGWLVDDELVLGRAAGVLARPDDERAFGGDQSLARADGDLVQLGGREVDADGASKRGARRGRGGRGHQVRDSNAGALGRIDRPRVMRTVGYAGVGFRSRVAGDASTMSRRTGHWLRFGCGGSRHGLDYPVAMTEPEPNIRPARAADDAAIADVQLRSFHAAMPSITLAHTDDEVRDWIATIVLPDPGLETWVAEDAGGSVVGMMVLSADMIEQLYLLPEAQGAGLGDRFIALAKTRRPDGLSLYAFQVNARARHFYEKHGFEAVWFGDGSGNEEHEPDLRYEWGPRP